MNDYHAFTSTCGDGNAAGGNAGGSPGCLPWLIAFLTILWIIGKFFS